VLETHQKVDYISIVPDGEPTLDLALSEIIVSLKTVGIPVAVITNSSLLWKNADWVSLKIDVSLDKILQGMQEFAATYSGTLCTETMLVRDLNDNEAELKAIASFLKENINPSKAYIGIPTRPPAPRA